MILKSFALTLMLRASKFPYSIYRLWGARLFILPCSPLIFRPQCVMLEILESNRAIQAFYPLLDKDYDWVRGDKTRLQTLLRRAKQGEAIRIWVGTNADDMCGLYWFMSKLKPYRKRLGKVSVLKLPRVFHYYNKYSRSNKIEPIFSWGQLEFEDIANHMSFTQEITTPMIEYYAAEWLLLEKENAPLRALVCDCPISVPIDFYDHLILKEIEAMPDTFPEYELLPTVLGNYALGIQAMFAANRITALAEMGKLIVVEDPRDCDHLCNRIFAKPIDKANKNDIIASETV